MLLLLLIASGAISLYWGLTDPRLISFFGLDASVWLGLIWILLGVTRWRTVSAQEDRTSNDDTL